MEKKERVLVRRLDNVLDNCIAGISSPRIYLKLDTQGFDLEVVRGAESTLRRVLAVQTEVSFRGIYDGMADFSDAIREFRERGFEVVDFMPVSRDIDQLCAIEMDCILARRLK